MDNPFPKTERTMFEARILIMTALTMSFFQSQELSREEALIVTRSTAFMLEEIIRGVKSEAIAGPLRDFVLAEIDQLLAKRGKT